MPSQNTAASAASSPLDELQALIASRTPLIIVESGEEARDVELAQLAGLKAGRGRGRAAFQWTVTEGLSRLDRNMGGPQKAFAEPEAMLKHLKAGAVAGVYVLLDFHPYLENPICVRLLRDVAQGYEKTPRTVVLISHEVKLPQELEHLAARFRLAHPGPKEREVILMRVAQDWANANGRRAPELDPQLMAQLVQSLSGLPASDVERLARQVIFDDGALSESDLKSAQKAKYQLLNRGGTLAYEPDTARFAD